jgi:hypothetical protein
VVSNKHNNIEVNVTENKAKGEMTIRQHVFYDIFIKKKTISVHFILHHMPHKILARLFNRYVLYIIVMSVNNMLIMIGYT